MGGALNKASQSAQKVPEAMSKAGSIVLPAEGGTAEGSGHVPVGACGTALGIRGEGVSSNLSRASVCLKAFVLHSQYQVFTISS